MWRKEVSIATKKTKEEVWKLWSNVSDWNLWDEQVIESKIDGAFIINQKGYIKPKSGPKSTFEIIELTKGKSFTNRSKLPLGKIDFVHEIKKSLNGELIITHRIEISGVLTFLFSKVIGNKLIKELPKALNNLVNLIEAK